MMVVVMEILRLMRKIEIKLCSYEPGMSVDARMTCCPTFFSLYPF